MSIRSEQSPDSLMLEGKQILSQIPGVREVFTGEAMKDNSHYRFCWSVRFTHKVALDCFRKNHDFNTFLKNRFNHDVTDLICIDYQEKK